MSDFAFLPLQKLLNQRNPISRIENLERNRAVPSARVGQLGQIGQSTGDMVVDGSIVVANRTDGLPDVTIDDFGVSFRNQEGNLTFEDTNGSLDNLVISSDADNFLVLRNAFGGKGISFHIDDAVHNVTQIDFDDTGVYLYDGDYNGAAGAKYLIDGVSLGYALTATSANNTPADATTYYFGSHPGTAFATTASRRRVYIPRAGTVKRIDLFFTFVAGSNEQSTMSFRLNDTSDTAITTTLDLSTNPVAVANSGLSIAVAAGDFFEIKWVTPTWATNPTAVSLTAQVWIEF
jgi:hypothetical protein